MLYHILFVIISLLLIIILLLIAVAFFTLVERKFMGSIQRRKGPNVIGFLGLLQPLADGLKLFSKETILPSNANFLLFVLAPTITFVLSLVGWGAIPFAENAVLCDINVGVLYLFAVSSLSVYGIICAGWSSNSKYPFLGALRSAAQMVSYEVSIGFILIAVVACVGSFNLTEVVKAQTKIFFIIPLFPMFFLFFISALAETNRHPFDLPEAEAELVSGYNVEYSAMAFALFFLGEYANMLLMSALSVILFLGGWLTITPFFFPGSFCFSLKLAFFVLCFVWARAALPRYRYDQLMSLGWKTFLPFSLSWLILTTGVLIARTFKSIFLYLLSSLKRQIKFCNFIWKHLFNLKPVFNNTLQRFRFI
jgi:NADH-quinone oxidoreductase subunit H